MPLSAAGGEPVFITVVHVNSGDELMVWSDECILGGGNVEWPMEMTFDCGAREVNGSGTVDD